MDICGPTNSYHWWQTPSKLKGEESEWNSRSILNLLKFKVIYGTVRRIPVIIERHIFFRTHAAFCPRRALIFLCFFLSAIWWPFEQDKRITHRLTHLSPHHTLHCWLRPKPARIMSFPQRRLPNPSLLKNKIPKCAPITIMQILKFLTAWKCLYILHLDQEREQYSSQRCPFIRLPSSWFLTP